MNWILTLQVNVFTTKRLTTCVACDNTGGSSRRRRHPEAEHHRFRRTTEASRGIHTRRRVPVEVGSWQVLQPVRSCRQSERQLRRE